MRIVNYESPDQIKKMYTPKEDDTDKVFSVVREVIANVRGNGDSALYEYTEKFDKAKLTCLKVSEQEIQQAYDSCDEFYIETLKIATQNITKFHEHQKHNNFVITGEGGTVLGQKYTPIEKVGVYVPGGTASYPSTVLMDVIPAKIAGVSKIVMVTPPLKDGTINPSILAAAKVAGVDEIYKLGGAQAIAALSYGTESVPQVDKIVGPGNIYVATAKQLVFGQVDIDMIAGPSDILIIADETANPRYLGADLLSQAEHDVLATASLITTDENLAKLVSDQVEQQLKELPREDIARTSIDNNGYIILVKDMEQAVYVGNLIAPEHLEICTKDPFALLDSVKNAGSIFLGQYTPEAIGDYFAGPNHTLPTSGTARFSSPLSVDDFIKKSSFIYYTKDQLNKVKDHVTGFARHEGLEAHAQAICKRFE